METEEGTMQGTQLDVVTGAFGYTGKYIARRLLAQGRKVKTLTGHPGRPNPFGEDRVAAAPFNFEKPNELRESLRGVSTLYNTYWVRFSHGPVTFEDAVQNTKTLIAAASDAGVKRFVHVSITNPSLDSPLPYFNGKARLEQALAESSLSYAIVRPTVIFGIEDILVNNIAWLLRHFPVFVVPGSGDYRLQPIYVEDMAQLVVDVAQREENVTLDAVGPDIFTFDEMVRLIAEKVGSKARIVHTSPGVALFLSRLVGYLVNDVTLTPDEVDGLTANLLVSESPPTGHTHLADWLAENVDRVGTGYASELARHYR